MLADSPLSSHSSVTGEPPLPSWLYPSLSGTVRSSTVRATSAQGTRLLARPCIRLSLQVPQWVELRAGPCPLSGFSQGHAVEARLG